MEELGFIMLRHVNNESVNKYWINCYYCIRKYYPENPIVIIDDNSNYTFITNYICLYKTTIINSEYKGRGELLPYYYYSNSKFFNKAVIIHDSVFINSYIDFTSCADYKLIWEFEPNCWWDQIEDETRMIKLFNDKDLLSFYENKSLWKGCFGGMTVITHDYLSFINHKYNISILLDCVLNRYNRCSFERVIACLLQKNKKKETLLGNIHEYCEWGINIDQIQQEKVKQLPIIKVWSGR